MTPRFSIRDLTRSYATNIYAQCIFSLINAHLDYGVAHGLTARQAWQEACPEIFA